MLRITIIAVGSLKEKYHQQAVDEYLKRLSAFVKLEIIEITESKIVNESSKKLIDHAVNDETQRQLAKIPDNARVIILDSRGDQTDSEGLANKLNEWTVSGTSHLVFLIGGSHGFGADIESISHWKWSFSKLTFTHQMIRSMLLEQLYRAFKINKGDSYHK